MLSALVAAVVASLLTLHISHTPSPEAVTEKVSHSIAPLQIPETGSCTSFAVAKELFLSAAHCFRPGITVNNFPVRFVYASSSVDLMLVYVPNYSLPALKIADQLRMGEKVLSFGFAVGRFSVGEGIASHLGDKVLVVWNGFVWGMSGGPVVNMKGEVVAVVQRSPFFQGAYGRNPLGEGVNFIVVREFLQAAIPELEQSKKLDPSTEGGKNSFPISIPPLAGSGR